MRDRACRSTRSRWQRAASVANWIWSRAGSGARSRTRSRAAERASRATIRAGAGSEAGTAVASRVGVIRIAAARGRRTVTAGRRWVGTGKARLLLLSLFNQGLLLLKQAIKVDRYVSISFQGGVDVELLVQRSKALEALLSGSGEVTIDLFVLQLLGKFGLNLGFNGLSGFAFIAVVDNVVDRASRCNSQQSKSTGNSRFDLHD